MHNDTVKNDTLVNFLSSLIFVILFLGISILLYSCKSESEVISNGGDPTQEKSLISGQVVDRDTGFPIDSAFVRIFGNTIDAYLFTSASGQYSVEAEFENNEILLITVLKSGYKIDTSSVEVVAGEDLVVPLVELRELGGDFKN